MVICIRALCWNLASGLANSAVDPSQYANDASFSVASVSGFIPKPLLRSPAVLSAQLLEVALLSTGLWETEGP